MKMDSCLSKGLVVFFLSIALSSLSGCKKTDISPIQGLWNGTYTVGSTNPSAAGQSFFFSFSIYSDGTMTYKGKTPGNEVYANGTWSLTGTNFSFNVTTLNYDGGLQHTQTGTATYNSQNGSLSNGTIVDLMNGGRGTWTLTRVN